MSILLIGRQFEISRRFCQPDLNASLILQTSSIILIGRWKVSPARDDCDEVRPFRPRSAPAPRSNRFETK
jgi:hypothetical protein